MNIEYFIKLMKIVENIALKYIASCALSKRELTLILFINQIALKSSDKYY